MNSNQTLKLLKGLRDYLLPEAIVLAFVWPLGRLSGLGSREMLIITLLLIGQNASFTLVSRARQSANLKLHMLCALASNGFYIFVLTAVVAHYTNLWLKLWYILCTVVGSVHAHYLSLHKIEQSKHFRQDALVTRAELQTVIQQLKSELQEAVSVVSSRERRI